MSTQHIFSWRNKKNARTFRLKKKIALSISMRYKICSRGLRGSQHISQSFAKSAGTGNQDKHSYSVMKLLHLLITELLNIYPDEKIEYRSKRGWEYDGVRGGGGGEGAACWNIPISLMTTRYGSSHSVKSCGGRTTGCGKREACWNIPFSLMTTRYGSSHSIKSCGGHKMFLRSSLQCRLWSEAAFRDV